MKLFGSFAAVAVMLTATVASAEYIRFDDSAADRISVDAGGFLYDPLNVNGSVYPRSYSGASYDFAKGSALNFAGTYQRAGAATNEDSTYLYVTADQPTRVIGQLQLNRTSQGGDAQRVDGTFYGVGSGYNFATLGTGTTVVLTFQQGDTNVSPTYAVRQLIDGNFDLNVAITPGAVPEPATWAMMIGGFAMVGGAMRRRRLSTKVSFA